MVLHDSQDKLDLLTPLLHYIKDEITVKNVSKVTDSTVLTYKAKPDFRILGKRLEEENMASKMKSITAWFSKCDQQTLKDLKAKMDDDPSSVSLSIEGVTVSGTEIVIARELNEKIFKKK